MGTDALTEFLTGCEEAVTVIGKIIVFQKGDRGSILIAGSVVRADEALNRTGTVGHLKGELVQNPGEEGGDVELWECEILLKPRRKLSHPTTHLKGATVNRMLTGGFEKPENWGKEVWRAKDCQTPPLEGKESE